MKFLPPVLFDKFLIFYKKFVNIPANTTEPKVTVVNPPTNIVGTIVLGEPLPLVEMGASWEVYAFVSHIYLPSSSGSPYPDIFF